eukprot:jgi/Undpi1/3260/HiC_scaffold_15.g06634.m1
MSGMPNYQSLVDEQPTGAMPALVEGESLPRQPDKSCTDSCQICCLKFTDSCFPWYKDPTPTDPCTPSPKPNPNPHPSQFLAKLQVDPVTPPVVPPPPGGVLPVNHRTDAGNYNEIDCPSAGSAGQAFGRNCPGYPPNKRRELIPDPFVVAEKLLARRCSGPDSTYFKPAGAQLNILAAAWIQAMVHDWMDHTEGAEIELTAGAAASGCPMAKFNTRTTASVPGVNGHPAYPNRRTHWWDVSFVYGSDSDTVGRTRTGEGGRVVAGEGGVMEHADNGVISTGDTKNSWVGVSLLQALFSMEHNSIADEIAIAHPAWNDEEIFRKARLAVCAIVAKIHTIDWTVELLKTDVLRTGMRINWYGIIGKYLHDNTFLGKVGNGVISGLAGMKEMEVANETVEMEALCAVEGEDTLRRIGAGPFWESAIRDPCGSLELFNYPSFFRKVPPTDNAGVPMPDAPVDLAVLDIFRDRARGVPRFNDMRRAMNMNPIKKWSDLTKNKEYQDALQEVYGDDVDLCDTLVGNLAEDKIEGFAISETSFHIFIVMASRRLESDRFLTKDFTPEVYSQEGYDRVFNTEGIKDLLLRHFPDIAAQVPEGQSAFKPWRVSS